MIQMVQMFLMIDKAERAKWSCPFGFVALVCVCVCVAHYGKL